MYTNRQLLEKAIGYLFAAAMVFVIWWLTHDVIEDSISFRAGTNRQHPAWDLFLQAVNWLLIVAAVVMGVIGLAALVRLLLNLGKGEK